MPPAGKTDDVGPYQVTMTGHALVGESVLGFAVEETVMPFAPSPTSGPPATLSPCAPVILGSCTCTRSRIEGGTDITFVAEFPSAGTYRLFLDFAHDGDVHTAAFTVEVPSGAGPGGH